MTAVPADTATAARRSSATVLGLGAVAVSGLALSALYATTGLGVPCPFRSITGWDCPFCGGTRMGAALLHGDLAAAWAYNPFALVALVVATVVGLWLVAERAVGRQGVTLQRLRTATGGADRRFSRGLVWVAGGLVLVAWVLVRNLVLGPLP